ncbi:MAG: B12-binding domain-containing radical SAM protein [bacterium]|nr:B12-binding domain-containing radical SAM protein [bacterium]
MKNETTHKNVLLLKVPHCIHPDAIPENDSFRLKHTFRPIPSFALASLCAFLEKYNTCGYDIKAVDIAIEAYKKVGTPIDIYDYPALLEEQIKNREYDVLAISVMFVFNVRWLQQAVDLSRKYHPEAKIMVGGGYPTIFPEKCLRDHDIDSVVIGEGEATLVHLLNRYNNYSDPQFEEKFPLDGYGENNPDGTVNIVPLKTFVDMNDIPVAAWDYLDVHKYFKNSGERMLAIEGVRGCPYHCTFCNTQLSWGYKLRYKKVDTLISEMLELDKKYGAYLHFIDDNRSVKREWMLDFLHKVLDNKIQLEPVPSSFHVHHLDSELLDLIKKGGIKTVGLAVESGSPEMQKCLKKNLNFDKVKEVVQLIKEKGLRVHINYLFGYPNETMAQIEETLKVARQLRAHSNQFLILVPYPGTEIYEEAKKDNLLLFEENDLDNFEPRRSNYLYSDEWTAAQLETIIYDANIELNFLDNAAMYLPGQLDDFREFCENLLLRIPGHIAAYLVVGYIYKEKKDNDNSERFYQGAIESFKDPGTYETFYKYLSMDNKIVKEFNQYCSAKGIKIEKPEAETKTGG